MDWNLAIERNNLALRRIVASLFALAGLTGGAVPSTLPRHLYCAALTVLRPAESALRRLIIIAARDLVVVLSPAERARITRTRVPVRRSPTGIFLRGHVAGAEDLRRARGVGSIAQTGEGKEPAACFVLFDPLKRFGATRQGPSQWVPRIVFNLDGGAAPALPARSPLSPDDPVGATRLCRRLTALDSALDDLPGQALRLARWRARRDLRQGQRGRLSPMRPGSPPGHRKGPSQPVDEVLSRCHGLALDATHPPDTS
tara:strand:- start:1450 stop:2220 length:771 start_codon:yes stop_codon:yes gene_type:complete